jgi:hypothetical protein
MVDATKTNRAWLLNQNEHALLLQIQKGIERKLCILETLDPKTGHTCPTKKGTGYPFEVDCSTCIANWLNEEHK